jgi:hypothetical protein
VEDAPQRTVVPRWSRGFAVTRREAGEVVVFPDAAHRPVRLRGHPASTRRGENRRVDSPYWFSPLLSLRRGRSEAGGVVNFSSTAHHPVRCASTPPHSRRGKNRGGLLRSLPGDTLRLHGLPASMRWGGRFLSEPPARHSEVRSTQRAMGHSSVIYRAGFSPLLFLRRGRSEAGGVVVFPDAAHHPVRCASTPPHPRRGKNPGGLRRSLPDDTLLLSLRQGEDRARCKRAMRRHSPSAMRVRKT